MAWFRGKLSIIIIIFQVVFIILFGLFADYEKGAQANGKHEDGEANDINRFYGVFQDVHVMIFVGFGFLMTFLKKYGYGAIGFNFLLAAFAIQWATLIRGFFELEDGKFHVGIQSLIGADFSAAVVLISFGAVLGKTSPVQLVIMTLIEVVLSIVNEHIGLHILTVTDVGGSMFIHAFGAYFGIAVAWIVRRDANEGNAKEGSTSTSDLFSMIGTIFLWLFWPSFNGALVEDESRHRAVLNTYFSLAACCVVTFAVTSLINKNGKVEMVAIQNATLAGGVAVGSSADLMIGPWGAICIGSVAAIVSTLGFKYCTPFLCDKLKIHDTCGVNNLHGMPGIMGGVAAAIATTGVTLNIYGDTLNRIFPEVGLEITGTEMPRTVQAQAGYQILALVITLAIAIGGGLFTGLILKLRIWDEPAEHDLFSDYPFWDDISGGSNPNTLDVQYAPLPAQEVEGGLVSLNDTGDVAMTSIAKVASEELDEKTEPEKITV